MVRPLWFVCCVPFICFAQDLPIERLDPQLDALIPLNAKIETLCSGFGWAEGPLWDAKENRLLFSDVPANIIYQWKEGDKQAAIFMQPSGFTGPVDSPDKREKGSNGLAFDLKGQLLCCEHGDRRISYLTANGGKRTLADNFEGKRFHSPNDLCVAPSGDVYFADPPFGHATRKVTDPASEMEYPGVFRIDPQGKVSLITKELTLPNGVALTADGKTLYVANSSRAAPVIMAYALQADGSAGTGRVFFDMKNVEGSGSPDGLKVDAQGNVFTTGRGGVLIINAHGNLLGRIPCHAANVAFGNEGKFLYIAAVDRILRVPLHTH